MNRLKVQDKKDLNPDARVRAEVSLEAKVREDLNPGVSLEVIVEEDKVKVLKEGRVNRLRVRDRVKISKRVDRVKHQEVPGPAKTISRTQDQARM